MKYINQRDYPDIPYITRANPEDPRHERGKKTTIRSSGCGLCSALMVADRLLPQNEFSLEDVIPAAEDSLGKMVEHIALNETITTLPPLWRQIITLRYFREYSQQQTADALGLTQVKISREEKKIFASLRGALA